MTFAKVRDPETKKLVADRSTVVFLPNSPGEIANIAAQLRDAILVAQSGVAGSSVLGREVILGAQSGISGHLTVGDRSLVHGQAGVMEDLPEGSVVVGSPAEDKREFFKSVVRTRKLGGLYDRVKELERRLAALEKE